MRISKVDLVYYGIAVLSLLYKLVIHDTKAVAVCLITLAILIGVKFLFHLVHYPLTNFLWALAATFIMLSYYMGNAWDIYAQIPDWDFYLHLFSGFMLSMFSFCLLYQISGYDRAVVMRYGFCAVFVFLFCVACAGLWEIYEFCGDMLFGLHSQGESLIDTMTDMIAGTIGCLPSVGMLLAKKIHPAWIPFFSHLLDSVDRLRAKQKTEKTIRQ